MKDQELIPHLFRTEFSKITTVLCKHFGIENLQVAEDMASDTFLAAVETWSYKGLPDNPTAWLYTVAKNKAHNYIRRNHLFSEKVSEQIKQSSANVEVGELDLSEKNITDSQLQMLFALCHPSIPAEAQIGLSLRILCGFGIDEIANAFLTNKETINKRLFRAKEKLKSEKVSIELPAADEINSRLDTVLVTLYLLYNEGYYSESNDAILREDLCLEAMRLTALLLENKQTNLPAVNALMALMCFHSSRFKARKNSSGEIILYDDQDETLWNNDLIAKGAYYLHQAAQGNHLTKYHLEASIAYWHTIKQDTSEKWENILQLYNKLLVLEYSPIAALNRTYALSKVKGKTKAIAEAEKLNLTNNHYYYTLLGELYREIDNQKAKENLEKALSLAATRGDRQIIQSKINRIS
jgi:RNA polymerase sigma-70 factor (ECF subfamily)